MNVIQKCKLPARIQTQTKDALYYLGKTSALSLLERLPDFGLTVVGTRNPQQRSLDSVDESIEALASSELIILSGLARGIDAAAHEAALRAGLPTVAILGSGLSQIYPPENKQLAERIAAQGGLVISEYPPQYEPRPYTFLNRNRLLAHWSKLTWVVEASFRSGALNTARWARDFDRTLLATPCFPGDSSFAGNQALLDRHHASPYWGVHSLGEEWLHLSTASTQKKRALTPPGADLFPDAQLLTEHVVTLTSSQGGCSVAEALQWGLSAIPKVKDSWSPAQFFSALQDALRLNWLSDEKGTLLRRRKNE